MDGPLSTTISTSVLELVRQGDADAWQQLAECYTYKVYCWCRFVGVPEQDTVDIAQEVMLQTFRHLPTFSRDRSRGESLTAWMYTVARNRIRDYFRARRPALSEELDLFPAAEEAGDSPELPETAETSRMAEFCNSLDSVQRKVDSTTWNAFWRLAVDGDSVKDIAWDTGLSEGAVRQAKYRIIQMLRASGRDVTR